METNPIYDFLKTNNLTTKDESSFMSDYSSPEKVKDLHGFFVSNKLTTKGFDDFYGEYFEVKKKEQAMPFDGQQFGGKSKEPLLPLTSSTASPSVSKQPKSTTPLESTGEKSKGKTGSEAPLKQDGTPFVPIIPNLEIGKPWKEKTNTKEFELPKQYTSEKPYIEADIQTRQALDALPAYSRSVIGNGSFKRDFAEYLKQNPKDAQKMITWKGGDVKAQAEQFDVLTKFYRQKAEPLILKLEEYDAKGVGAALEKANQVYVNLDKVQDELKKNQSQVNFYLNTYLEQNGYSDIVKQAKELKSKVNSFDAKSFSETEKSIKQELGAVEAEIQPLLVNGSIPQENYQQYLELKSRADSLVAEYNGLIQSPEVLEYSKNVADLNELIASQNELATGLQSNSQYKKAFSSYEAVSKKYTDLISQAQQFDDMKTDFKGYISTANQVSDITKKYDNISKGFPDVISRNELQKKIDILGEQGDATKAKSLGVLQSLPQSANSIFSGIGSALAKMDKVMQGADDKDYYSVYDKMSDYYDNLNKFNSFIVPSPKAIRKDGSLNWSELGYEALSQWGNMAIFASVGGYGKAPTVATAYFMSRKGREEEAEQAGLTGASKEAYVSTLSTLEGLSELIMPDNQLFTAPIKKLLLKEAVMAQSKGINWFRKRALAVVLENSGKEAAEEYVVKLGELMQKVASNYSNGNAFDLSEYKNVNEWLRTGLVAAPLAGLSSSVSQVNVPKKELEVARYEAAKNLTQARDILDDLVEGKKMTTEKADAEYKKIVNYAAVQSIIPKDISNNKAVELVPLLIENEKLKLQMENVDEVFKEGIKEKISANIEKAKEILNQKEEKIVEENIDALPESPMEVVKAEMPEEIANLNDDETIAISVNNINDVPEAYRDRVKEGELKGTAQKSFLGLFGYGKKVDVSKKTYSYTITGKEAKEEWLNQNIGEEKDAIKTKDEVSSGDTVARTDNTGAKDGDIASATDKGESGKGVVNQEEIERLRAQEQVEVDATDPNDQEKLDEIYNRYNELITPLLEGEKEVKYNIDEARQQFIKDNEIEAFQEKFGYEPYNPFESLPDGVYETILRVEDNTPTSLTAIEEASKWLYSQYKMLEAKKVADTRDMTIPQIDEVLSELEGTITELENFKNKLYEESGQAKGGQDTTPVQAVDGQTSEGVRVGKEVATPTQEVAKEEISEQAKISKQNERANDRKPAAGNRLFNEPIKEIGAIADKYFKRVFGKERPKFKGTRKFDKTLSRKIAEAYAKMENNPNSAEVKASYNALVKETLAQYKALKAAGYEIEISEEDSYKNSQEMIDDVVKNKRIKIFSTEAGFGNKPISKKSRKENPMLMQSGMKDKNGVPLLNNDLFRAVHDIIGHGELGNSFGAIGEENAFQIHARLYSPLARKALATETRGQNSFVNFSGINDKVSLMVEEARKLRAEGKEAEAQKLVEKIYEDLSFAEQKIGILPEEFYSIDESFEGEVEEPVLSESAKGKENETQQIANELLNLLGLAPEETDVKFSKKTGEPQVLTPTEDKEQQIIDQMNKMNLVNEGIDLAAPSTTEEEIDLNELNSRLDNPLETIEWADYEGIPFTFTISDQLRTGDAVNPNTGQTITDLKGGIGFNGTKGNENNAWANTTSETAESTLERAKDVYANNKPLFDKLWREGKLPDGHIPMAVVKMAEKSILSNEAVLRVGIQNIGKLPKANRKKAVLKLVESLQAKKDTESASLERGVDDKGKPYTKNTINLKKKAVNQYQKILDFINEKKYEDIADLGNDMDNFSLPEKTIISKEIFYGEPNPAGAKSKKPSEPKTSVSVALVEGLDVDKRKLIHLGAITDLLTEPSMKNVPNMHIVSVVGVDVRAKGINKVNHPNYPYGVKGVSLGVLKNPVHMKDVFGEAYGSALGQIVKNEANSASISMKNVFSQGIPVQAGLPNRVFKSAIAKGKLDAVDKLAGFLRQAFPSTTFFTSNEAWDAAMEDPSIKKKLKDGDVVYAFTTDGNVFINPSLKTTKATLHETGHIWMGFVKENNPALYAKGLKLVTGTKEHQKAIQEYGDTELAREEALMELMSSKGDTIVNASQKAKFKEWLLSAYKYIADNFTSLLGLSPKQIENLTLDKFLEGMLADLLSGKELTTKKMKGGVKFSREAQDNKIGDFVESQRKAGKSDSNIRAALELIADRLGLSALDIDNLMDAEKIENSKKAFEFWLNLESDKEQFIVSTKIKSEAAKAGIDEKALKNAAKTMKNISEIREKLLNAKVIETIDCKWG